jgi:hypothetical protein
MYTRTHQRQGNGGKSSLIERAAGRFTTSCRAEENLYWLDTTLPNNLA